MSAQNSMAHLESIIGVQIPFTTRGCPPWTGYSPFIEIIEQMPEDFSALMHSTGRTSCSTRFTLTGCKVLPGFVELLNIQKQKLRSSNYVQHASPKPLSASAGTKRAAPFGILTVWTNVPRKH